MINGIAVRQRTLRRISDRGAGCPLQALIRAEEASMDNGEDNPADAPISYALDPINDPYWEDPYSWCHVRVFADGIPIMPGETTPFDQSFQPTGELIAV